MTNIDIVKTIIADTLGVKREDLKDCSKFEDLGADSLDIVELVLNIEDKFNIKIGEEEIGRLKTVKDVINYLNSKNL
ncbi:MAG: acyl carrier protein [Candidatus Omnitrophica bacterium]|nr:acyl carrier protein [Candidatus Omnitrophota bacterium]MDE2213666.1 acyl carrier protein [Candidatus Omnitrophota bacterium]